MATLSLTYSIDFTSGRGFDLSTVSFGDIDYGKAVETTAALYVVDAMAVYGGYNTFSGVGLTYDDTNNLTGGTVTGWEMSWPPRGGQFWSISDFAIPATTIAEWIAGGLYAPSPNAILFAGSDSFNGGAGGDTLQGEAGSDTILGGAGNDRLHGGTPRAPDPARDGANYLRGDGGDDTLVGGSAFDDINGNIGDDSASGGLGNDWVVGGKDQDRLTGDDGDDIVYGNLGSDTCDGGTGDDVVRGGQQDDVIIGGAGSDWLSGDRDNDTLTGGAGADTFVSFGEAGLDLVTDFNRSEGDRLLLDSGSTYAVAQSGSDAVIAIGGGAQVVLVGGFDGFVDWRLDFSRVGGR